MHIQLRDLCKVREEIKNYFCARKWLMETFIESWELDVVLNSFAGPGGESDYHGVLSTSLNLPEPVHRVWVKMRTLFKM